MKRPTVRMGTRGSRLALAQAEWVKKRLQSSWPDVEVELVIIRTRGDQVQDRPFHLMGDQGGIFIKEIEQALLEDQIDFAVHSGKDVSSQLAHGLILAAICLREDPRDVLISATGQPLDELPKGARIGTSSLRRQAELLLKRPDLEVVAIRGNVETRLNKMESGQVDALILAAAGLRRLSLDHRITEYLDPKEFIPSPAQGALALECRQDDEDVQKILAPLHDEPTGWAVRCERAFLAGLGAGCQIPLAAHAVCQGQTIVVDGLVAAPDGSEAVRGSRMGDVQQAEALGADLAKELTQRGAERILREWRQSMLRKKDE